LSRCRRKLFRVTEELAVAQDIVNQEAQYIAEKLKTPFTIETTQEILMQEAQANKKVATVKETFEKLIMTLKGVQWKN
jgi:hypothetical protein